MFQVKPPIGVDDQPHLGVSVLEVTHRREVPEPGPTPEELNVAILLRLGQVLNQVESLGEQVAEIGLNLNVLRQEIYRQTWGYRWKAVTNFCRDWWMRVKGVFNGS